MVRPFRHIHFVGIGGIGMSGIAEVLLNLGYQVSGSDLEATEITRHLTSLNALIYKGHKASHVKQPDVVVISSAVPASNPEVKQAKRKKIPVIPRAEMLAELMRVKHGIAIAGTHGKTTTTSMTGSLLTSCGVDPTVVIGGRLNKWGTNAKLGRGKYLVAEADESDGSFLLLSPVISVVTNIDSDHLDYYSDLKSIKQAFISFLNKLPFYGVAIVCGDDAPVQSILPSVNKKVITYGMKKTNDYQATNITIKGLVSSFDVRYQKKKIVRLKVRVPGIHNVQNALASFIVGRELGIKVSKLKKGLYSYTGVQRRFQIRGEAGNITVLDDYGHHPTEIKYVLDTCKRVWPKRRLVVAFQPHRYSRTKDLLKEFVGAFTKADVIFLTDIYPAGEKPIKGVSSKKLYQLLKKRYSTVHLSSGKKLIYHDLEKVIRKGDVVLTLGAGDIWKTGEELVESLKKHR